MNKPIIKGIDNRLHSRLRTWGISQMGRYLRSFSFVGLVMATLFFAASVTPSLLPRPYILQGILSGLSLAVGYGVGVAFVWLWRLFELPDFRPAVALVSKRFSAVVVAIVSVWFLWQMTFWQNSIRERMQMPPVETGYPYRIGFISVVCAVVLVFLARLFAAACRTVSRRLRLFLPRRIAIAVSVTVVGLLAVIVFNEAFARSLLNAADRAFAQIDQLTDEGVAQPTFALATGSSQSLVSWDTIGRRGKNFIAQGPTREEISEFTGREARSPLRVYVGLRSRNSTEDRAELALEELKRVGAFERKILIIATPTGTGWLDPSAVDSVEFLHDGDTAIVSIQYSYLPSWISLLVDPNRSQKAANALFDTVYNYWTGLPKDARPKLYLQGLSLGAMGAETSADLYTIFDDPIQGAVFSGTPFPSRQWQELVRDRKEGTSEWLPEFRDGSMVRFTNQNQSFGDDDRWGAMRTVYIQYASDPMVWFSPNLAWHRPSWLVDPRGPDVSPYVKWYPIVTFLQIAADLPMATAIPLGHGHNYSPSSYIDAWIAVTAPDHWQTSDTKRLKTLFANRIPAAF